MKAPLRRAWVFWSWAEHIYCEKCSASEVLNWAKNFMESITTNYASSGNNRIHVQKDDTAHDFSLDISLTCSLYFLRWKLLCALVLPNRASPTNLLHSFPLHLSTDTAASWHQGRGFTGLRLSEFAQISDFFQFQITGFWQTIWVNCLECPFD